MFEKILVPVDESDLGEKALTAALSVAEKFGAEVTLLRIHRDAASLDPEEVKVDLSIIDSETDHLLARAMARMTDAKVTPGKVRATVRSGPLVQIITDTADELMVDLIVMGTHGRSGVAELFLGSTSERVVAKTPISVLVVKPDGFPFLRD